MLPFDLDEDEKKLLMNTEIFPLKRRINLKLFALFEYIKQLLKDTPEHKQFNFPEGTDIRTGKISQGENYDQFPWVMLDFPKRFHQNDIFAFRTLCWFGHYYSCSLVLSGNCLQPYAGNLLQKISSFSNRQLFSSVGDDPWEHDIREPHFQLLRNLSTENLQQHIREKGFLKLSYQLSGNNAAEICEEVKQLYTQLLIAMS